MRNLLLSLALLLVAAPASARPGFYLGLQLGPTSVNGEDVDPSRVGNNSISGVTTTEIGGGLSGGLRLGYNILGYAAIETNLNGHGSQLFDAEERDWAAHWHTGVRAYPLWHWQHTLPEYLQPLEPSLFLGFGASYQVYTPFTAADEFGWSKWGSLRFGLGAEYFVMSFFKLGLEYSYIKANYGRFIFNQDDGIDFPVDPAASTSYHQLYLIAAFQFGPA